MIMVLGVKCITGVVGMAARPGPTDAIRKVLLSQGLSECPAPRISGVCLLHVTAFCLGILGTFQ